LTGPTGEQGPTGPTGPTGEQGPTGPQGPTGADALWNFTGPYSGGAAYAIGDIATYDGSTWYRINSNGGNVGDTPTEGTFWTEIAAEGEQGPTGPTGVQGPTGPQGAAGQSSSFYNYKLKTNLTSGDPGNTHIIYNNVTQVNATQINLSHIDKDGYDIDIFLALVKQGDKLIVQDASLSDNYQKWEVSGAPTIQTGYVIFPVTLVASGGTGTTNFGNNLEVIVALATIGPQGPIGPVGPTGPQGPQGNTGPQGPPLPVKLRRSDWVEPYSYCGVAVEGTGEDEDGWLITRIEVANDGSVTVLTAVNAVWDDRLTEVYS
jgi:hypothetical protein